jgi:hypothetical protein
LEYLPGRATPAAPSPVFDAGQKVVHFWLPGRSKNDASVDWRLPLVMQYASSRLVNRSSTAPPGIASQVGSRASFAVNAKTWFSVGMLGQAFGMDLR